MKLFVCACNTMKLGVILLVTSCCGLNVPDITSAGHPEGQRHTTKPESNVLLEVKSDTIHKKLHVLWPVHPETPIRIDHNRRTKYRNRSGKHRNQERRQKHHGKGQNWNKYQMRQKHVTHGSQGYVRRNVEKQVLITNRTLQILGRNVVNLLEINTNKELSQKVADGDTVALTKNSSLNVKAVDTSNGVRKQQNVIGNISNPTKVLKTSLWLNPSDMIHDGTENTNLPVNSDANGFYFAEEERTLETLAHILVALTGNENENTEIIDPCEKWMGCKDKLQKVFLGSSSSLPSCPCQYPSTIFYNDKIWDSKQRKYFRWKDVSGDNERLDVYKPGAEFCIRSLVAHGSDSLASQHCCYDRFQMLVTRGHSAGTPDFVSPEVSVSLHKQVDVLPWRLCKGDFTRFNKVRPPNNDNNCTANPTDDVYQQQAEMSKHF